MNTFKTRLLTTAICGVIACGLAQQAHAANLVQNGDFSVNGGTGELNYNTTLADWTSANLSVSPGVDYYNFVFTSATEADTTGGGAATQFNNNAWFWGPNNTSPVLNGFTASPAGPDFVGMDSITGGSVTSGPISQMINGLTTGDTYALSFYWAGAQQAGYTGPTTDYIAASLGGETNNTTTINVASQGFVPWAQVTMDFTASSSSELLSFLAVGTPNVSDPPFVLLNGVDLEQVTSAPDTASTVLLFGFSAVGLAFAARRYGRQCRS